METPVECSSGSASAPLERCTRAAPAPLTEARLECASDAFGPPAAAPRSGAAPSSLDVRPCAFHRVYRVVVTTHARLRGRRHPPNISEAAACWTPCLSNGCHAATWLGMRGAAAPSTPLPQPLESGLETATSPVHMGSTECTTTRRLWRVPERKPSSKYVPALVDVGRRMPSSPGFPLPNKCPTKRNKKESKNTSMSKCAVLPRA